MTQKRQAIVWPALILQSRLLLEGCLLFAGSSLLRSFEGVDLCFDTLNLDLTMGREVAEFSRPLAARGGSYRADLTDGPIDNALTALAFVDDGLARISRKRATLLRPEGTLGTGKNRLTLHGYSLLGCTVLAFAVKTRIFA